jgi:type IV pilus assembly protein PilN
MSTSTTALMPLDAAVSPEQALRILPIRARLLPDEILSGRNARRTRFLLIGAVVLVVFGMGGWYLLADKERDLAASDLASVTGQVDDARRAAHAYDEVTQVINERDQIVADLKVATAKDLPWYTLFDAMRSAASKKGGTLVDVAATLDEDTTGSTATSDTVGTMQISGTAKDKATVANVVDALAGIDGVEDVYLTATTAQDDSTWTFTLTAAVGKDYVCGRFSTTTCGSK